MFPKGIINGYVRLNDKPERITFAKFVSLGSGKSSDSSAQVL